MDPRAGPNTGGCGGRKPGTAGAGESGGRAVCTELAAEAAAAPCALRSAAGQSHGADPRSNGCGALRIALRPAAAAAAVRHAFDACVRSQWLRRCHGCGGRTCGSTCWPLRFDPSLAVARTPLWTRRSSAAPARTHRPLADFLGFWQRAAGHGSAAPARTRGARPGRPAARPGGPCARRGAEGLCAGQGGRRSMCRPALPRAPRVAKSPACRSAGIKRVAQPRRLPCCHSPPARPVPSARRLAARMRQGPLCAPRPARHTAAAAPCAADAGSGLKILITHQRDTFISARGSPARRVFICLSQG